MLPHPFRAPLRVAAIAALLVLALGLPRLLVLCDHGDGDATLAFAHAEGSCCHAAPSHGGTADHDGPALAADHGCTHTDLAIELLPAPRPLPAAAPAAPPACDLPAVTTSALPALRAGPRPPPATGPPRGDRRTALRATTLLLV